MRMKRGALRRAPRYNRAVILRNFSSLLFAAILLSTIAAHAETLHEFEAPAQPASSLVDGGDGFFYGTAVNGGLAGKGEIYKINLTTGERTTLASFDGSNGANPYGDVLVHGQFLYGTTSVGGPSDFGTVYKFDRTTGKLTTVYAFQLNDTDGFYPQAGLVAFGPFLYGTTYAGSVNDGGTIFKVDPATDAVTTVVSFGSLPQPRGQNSASPLIASGSFLYGTTHNDASPNGPGMVFKFDPGTGAVTMLTTTATINGNIFEGLVPAGSFLYGVASFPASAGSVFKLDPATGAVITVVDLQRSGIVPRVPVGLCFDGTFLYGMTVFGGNLGRGTIFKLDPTSGTVTMLVSFDLTNGAAPLAAPIVRNGVLYGTTSGGGPNYGGTIFRFDLSKGELKTLAVFNDSGEGATPSARLMRNGQFLYGTTYGGGASGLGTIYRLDPLSGAFDLVAPLTSSSGGNPASELTAAGGKLYGTAQAAGSRNNGTVYSVDPSTGALAAVAVFDRSNGAAPHGGLVLSGDALYGTTTQVTNGYGTVFRLDPATGTLTTIFKFNPQFGHPMGTSPQATLLPYGPYLYGTTAQGGFGDYGTVFRINPADGSFTHLASVVTPPDTRNHYPSAGLTAVGSFLYGTGVIGGTSGNGSIYKIDPDSGAISTIFSFDGAHGHDPGDGTLVTDGAFLYGTTASGGAYGHGTVFRFDPVKRTLTIIKSFALTDGDSPSGGLFIDGGYLYGTTQYGGAKGGGTLFRVPIPQPRRRAAR
jgi:uncharacterized repeat protein (TIGR03803 family)